MTLPPPSANATPESVSGAATEAAPDVASGPVSDEGREAIAASDATGKSVARLLIVDDDQTYLALCSRYLDKDSDYRYQIVTATGAAEAIAACEEAPFDCLLIDYGLPDSTGTDLIGTLRERLDGRLPPVVVISAHGTADAAIEAVRADAADFLTKREVSGQALRRSIGNAVEKGRLKRSVAQRRRELQRANGELERRAIEIQRFYHTVSHEMKTPLTAAREFVAIVRDGLGGPVTDEQTALLDHALECCDQITTQFNDLIDLTRLETGKLRLERRPESLEAVVERSLAMCRSAAAKKSIALSRGGEKDLPPLEIDAGRIAQVLSNLIGNAVKFTPPGGRVRLDTRRSADAPAVEISVVDSGVGIDKVDQERIFDRLYQVRIAADDPDSSGLGLGLSIAREIVRGHGGELEVASEVGRGSTFTFTLPIASGDTPPEGSEQQQQGASGADHSADGSAVRRETIRQ